MAEFSLTVTPVSTLAGTTLTGTGLSVGTLTGTAVSLGVLSSGGGGTGSGSVTSVETGGGLAGGPITSSGTISHDDTSTQANISATANTYVDGLTFDDYGHVTGVSTVAGFDGNYSSLAGAPTLFDGAYGSLTGVPTTFAPSSHTHAIVDITGLQTALDAKQDASSAFDGAYSSLTGLPTLFDGDYNSLTNQPSLFDGAYGSLTGVPADFTPSAHTLSSHSDVSTASPQPGQVLAWNSTGSTWEPQTVSGGGGGVSENTDVTFSGLTVADTGVAKVFLTDTDTVADRKTVSLEMNDGVLRLNALTDAGATQTGYYFHNLNGLPHAHKWYGNNGTSAQSNMELNSAGDFKLPQYGSGTTTGTAAYSLAVDASGNVIEEPLGGGSSPTVVRQTKVATSTFSTTDDTLTWTHGQGAAPILFWLELECTQAVGGAQVGDIRQLFSGNSFNDDITIYSRGTTTLHAAWNNDAAIEYINQWSDGNIVNSALNWKVGLAGLWL